MRIHDFAQDAADVLERLASIPARRILLDRKRIVEGELRGVCMKAGLQSAFCLQ